MEVFELKNTYNALRASISALNASFFRAGSDNGAAFVATRDGPFLRGDPAIDLATRAFEDIFYDWDNQKAAEAAEISEQIPQEDQAKKKSGKDGRETKVWLGGIAADETQLELAREVNRCKDNFQKAVHELRDRVESSKDGGDTHVYKAFRKLLKDNGLGLVSLRQAYRHIPVLDETPISIRFSFSCGGRSIKRMTIQQARDFLVKKGWDGKNIEVELDKLNHQKTDHILAQVQELAGYYKANVIWPEPEDGEAKRQTIPVFLPILYLSDSEVAPEHQAHLPPAVKTRIKPRSDKKLAAEPFIEALRLYAYKDAIKPVDSPREASVDNRSA